MDDAAREARNAYYRAYRKANPEKVKRWRANYWKHKAEKQAEGGEADEREKESA